MRILHVITDTDGRGAQVFARDLQAALSRRGHSVDAVALAPGSAPTGLRVPVLALRRHDPRVVPVLRRRMAASDVTVAHGSTTGLLCALAGTWLDVPFVYRQISASRFWAPTRSRRLRVRTALRRARLVVALSPSAARDLVDFIGVDASRVRIVPNGVPSTPYTPAEPTRRSTARVALGVADETTILYVGALVPEKGVDVAIEAVARAREVQLVVVGEGPERGRLEKLAERGAAGRVRFLGWIAEPRLAYAAADLVVLPSKGGDSMPATLIEAGYCALPAISTRIGSIDEIVRPNETGMLVEAGDIEGFCAAVIRLASSPSLRERFGSAARRHCLAHFDIDVVAASWEQVLQEATKPGSR